MKKYFAKYLPTEGELKEGNHTLWPSDHEGFYSGKVIKTNSSCITFLQSLNCKPFKLSLCTREINSDSFKVIGEISSEAKWVKEGDEFDEVEIKLEPTNPYKSSKDLEVGDPVLTLINHPDKAYHKGIIKEVKLLTNDCWSWYDKFIVTNVKKLLPGNDLEIPVSDLEIERGNANYYAEPYILVKIKCSQCSIFH